MPMAAPEASSSQSDFLISLRHSRLRVTRKDSSRNTAASPARQSASSADVISIRRTNRPIVPNTVMDTIRPSRARAVAEGVADVFISASVGKTEHKFSGKTRPRQCLARADT